MAKLKDDQIRWILSLDAKGVQGELVKVSSSIDTLKKSNADLAKEMKEAERAMNEAGKAMQKMEESGKTASKQYQYASTSFHQNAEAVRELQSQIDKNNQSIEQSKTRFETLNKSLGVNDMTMNQLRQRAADLQKQLDATSQKADPKAYNAIQKELEGVKGRMFDVQIAGKSMISQFASMNNPVGQAAQAVLGFGQALKVLIANPVGVIIMIIVAAFEALKKGISANGEAMNKFNQLLAPLKQGFEILMTLLGKLVELIMDGLLKAFEGLMNMLVNVAKFFGINTEALEKFNQNIRNTIELEKERQQLERDAQADIIKNAEDEAKIAELRNKSRQKDKISAQERLKMIEEADKLEQEVANRNVKRITDDLNLKIKTYKLQGKIAQDISDDKIRMMLEEGKILGTLTDDERKELVDLYANVTKAASDYFTNTQRLQMQHASTVKEINNEAKQAAKEALDKRLQDEENALNQSVNQLKQSRLQGLITEKEYNKQVEQLQIDSLNRKINIRGQEKDKIIQLEAQILDAQLKQQADADKELLAAIQKEKENQLNLLETAKNERLRLLQEQESDQKIYALRAAEIEAANAEARMGVIRQFSETLRQAEFQNEQARADAIAANEAPILEAEKQTLEKQADLRRLFARTTAEFERQYNIKTWDQRKAEELAILQKQFDEKLLAEETYLAAVDAVNKKYEDEKLRIRQQYGIASMSELYNAEMELLAEQHAKGLLTEEEFEQAKLRIKLEYAQKYAQQVQQILSAASDAVNSLQDAEMANMEKKYAAEIAAAGTNAKEVQRLEREKAQKKLDIEKKYADVQFAITAAQIVANTAMAIMQAFAQLGPIAGAIAAVIVGVAGIAQLVAANAQRQKVKSMTLEGGGGGEAPKTGEVKLRQGAGFAEGGSNTGSETEGDHTDGGYTGRGKRYEVAGWVPYHNGEYFVAVPEMKNPAVQDHVRAIDRIRRRRTTRNPLPAGFAEGGANFDTDVENIGSGIRAQQTNDRLFTLLDGLISGRLQFKTNYGVTEYQAAEREKIRDESRFTRN